MAASGQAWTLRGIVDEALAVRAALDALHSRYPRSVVEQTAIAGALNPEAISNADHASAAAAYVARRLDVISEETERGWKGEISEDGGLAFTREVRGVKEAGPSMPSSSARPKCCGWTRRPRTCRKSTQGPPGSAARKAKR